MEQENRLRHPPRYAEAIDRMPEVMDIRDDDLRAEVVSCLIECVPEYFWTAPASSSHHPPEHRARHGLWVHTKRVCTTFERLAPSMVNQNHLSWGDIDHGRAACILHDTFKFGEPPTDVGDTTKRHDVIAAEYYDDGMVLPEAVLGAIEAHNGPWYAGKPPETHLEQIVHIADMMASDENAHVAVKDPHPTLRDQFPRLEER